MRIPRSGGIWEGHIAQCGSLLLLLSLVRSERRRHTVEVHASVIIAVDLVMTL